MEFLQAADRAALHVSVSQVKLYTRCPKAYEMRHVLGAKPEHRSANLVLGTAVHTGLAGFYQALKDGVMPADEEVIEAASLSLEEAMKQDPPILLEDGETLADLLATVPLSRRALEQRFQRLLGRTPREEIQQVRLDRVRQLLTDTDLPLYTIAERTGFEHVEYLSVVFKRETKMTPSRYRAKARG